VRLRNPLAQIAIGGCVIVAAGCASSSHSTLAARFVKEGKPSIDYGDLPGAHPAPVQAKAPAPTTAAGMRSAASGLTVEATDQRLAAALLLETAAPSVDTHLAVAREYRRLGILDAAEGRIERAVRLDPKRADAQEALARVWRDWGSPERALGPAHRAVASAPRSASAANTLGTVLAALGNWRGAGAEFARAVELSNQSAWALSNQCYAEFMQGFRGARLQCERALQADPEFRAAHNNLGLVFAATGDLSAAREQFAMAGGPATAEFNLGIVESATANYDAAAEAFERAIEERPDYVAAKQRAHQARVHAMNGNR
jgi:Tfp pilus assembly protein PilF